MKPERERPPGVTGGRDQLLAKATDKLHGSSADVGIAAYLRQRRRLPGDALERQRDRRVREFMLDLPAVPTRRWAA